MSKMWRTISGPLPRWAIALLPVLSLAFGCTSITKREYGPYVRELDGASVLEISTYPADFPERLTPKDALFEKYQSSRQLNFQVFIRDASKSIGPNEHVESIMIHSFSYRIGDAPPKVLLTDYGDNFWMQGNPSHEQSGQPPILYVPDGAVAIEIRFTLNGTEYAFEGDMPANESRSTWPTAIVEQGV